MSLTRPGGSSTPSWAKYFFVLSQNPSVMSGAKSAIGHKHVWFGVDWARRTRRPLFRIDMIAPCVWNLATDTHHVMRKLCIIEHEFGKKPSSTDQLVELDRNSNWACKRVL
jgi:hypothetical protein